MRLFERCYSLGAHSRQKDFIVSNVKEAPAKTLTIDAEKHGKVSRQFYFTYEGIPHRVCGQFSCKTLDIQISGIQKYFEIDHNQLGLGSVGDRKGRHVPPNKTRVEKEDDQGIHRELPSHREPLFQSFLWTQVPRLRTKRHKNVRTVLYVFC